MFHKASVIYSFCLLSFFLIPSLAIHSQSTAFDKKQKIEWASVENAWKYRIIIRDITTKEDMITNETELSEYQFYLPPGEYEYQIIVLNPFGKVANSSKWLNLEIRQALQPMIRGFSPSEMKWTKEAKANDISLTVSTYNDEKGVRFYLEDEKGKTVEPLSIVKLEEEYRVVFESKKLSIGDYSLIMENPSKISDRSYYKLSLISPKQVLTSEELESLEEERDQTLLMGWAPGITSQTPSDDGSNENFETLPLSATFIFRQDLSNPLFDRAEALRPLHWEAQLDYNTLKFTTNQLFVHQVYLGFGLSYRFKFSPYFSLFSSIGMGLSQLAITESSLYGNYNQGEAGLSFQWGLSLQKMSKKSGALVELGFKVRNTEYNIGTFNMVIPFLAGGFRL